MLSSDLLWTAVLGLVIGGLGGLAVPDRRARARNTRTLLAAPALGVGAALVGGLIGEVLLGSGFLVTRLALAALASALLVGCQTLYLRERSLTH